MVMPKESKDSGEEEGVSRRWALHQQSPERGGGRDELHRQNEGRQDGTSQEPSCGDTHQDDSDSNGSEPA